MKMDGLYQNPSSPNISTADFFSIPESSFNFAPAASGRSGAGKYRPPSLVQALMAGGGGGTLPSGVVPLGHEKRAIESLLQKVSNFGIFHLVSHGNAQSEMLLTRCRDIFPQRCTALRLLSGLGPLSRAKMSRACPRPWLQKKRSGGHN
jgi:hypothetical protein